MIRGYMAASADGYVADADHKVDWLDRFDDVDYGYQAFIDQIDRVVMGRTTYDQVLEFDLGWPYPDTPGIVVTSRPLTKVLGDVTVWDQGVPALVDHLRAEKGDSWIVGGPRLQATFIEMGALDRLELFVIPMLLGGGVPLFTGQGRLIPMRLETCETFEKGITRLDYRF